MKKCLLRGFYGYRNLGDDLLYVESISKIPSCYHIYIYGNCPYPDDLNRDNVTLNRSYMDILSRKYDLTIVNGGGYFPSVKYKWKNLIYDILIRLRSRKMVLNGVGIAPKIGAWNRIRFKLFLKMLDYCSVRDDVSRDFINGLMNNHHCMNCHDLYFGKTLIPYNDKRNGVIICIANPFSKTEMSTEHFQQRYQLLIKNIQSAALRLMDNYGEVSFLSFFSSSDDIIIKDIISHPYLSDSRILIKGKDFNIDNIDQLFTRYKVGLCMRFHSFVLATRNCLPFVGICYDYKSESLLREMNLSEIGVKYGIRISDFYGLEIDFSENDILHRVDYVFNNYASIQNKLEYCRERFHQEVIKNYNKIYSLIGKT